MPEIFGVCMFSSAIIVFREVLEAALVITIVMAATQGVARRMYWIFGGVVAGIMGASIVAALAEQISMAFEGAGQELFNALVLMSAVIMLAWHNIWMSHHAKELVGHLKSLGSGVSRGELPMYFLCTAVGLAVLREGSEVVLFIYGIVASGAGLVSIISGSALGLAAGSLVGLLLYKGLLKINPKQLFTVTGWLILLLASGMAASCAGYLIQAGYLPSQQPLWDSSNIISQHSIFGQLLHVLIGYQDRPTAVQLLFYVGTFGAIAIGMRLARPSPNKTNRQANTLSQA